MCQELSGITSLILKWSFGTRSGTTIHFFEGKDALITLVFMLFDLA